MEMEMEMGLGRDIARCSWVGKEKEKWMEIKMEMELGRDIAGCSWVGTEKEKRMEMEMERGRDAYSWVFLGWHGAGNRMTFDDSSTNITGITK